MTGVTAAVAELPDNLRGRGVAAFDFDGTLTTGDSLKPWLHHGLGTAGWLAVLVRNAPSLGAYALGLRSNGAAKAALLRSALAGRSRAEIERWNAHWLAHWLPGHTRPWTLQRLHAHQSRGDLCLLVSASPDVYLHQVARLWKLDGLLCTGMAWAGDVLTGEMATLNCHGPQKVVRLQHWVQQHLGQQPFTLHAYGDSAGDADLLNLADYPWLNGRLLNRPTSGPGRFP